MDEGKVEVSPGEQDLRIHSGFWMESAIPMSRGAELEHGAWDG